MEATMEEGDCLSQEEESAWNDDLDVSQLCRICANPNEYLIPIFEGEGLEHELETKIVKHLPIKVTYSDELPTNLCYQCASTLIAWHDMVVGCVEADEKLRSAAHYKTGNNIKVIDRMVAKETPGGNNCESQNKIIPFTRINHTAYVSQEQDPKLITSAETEQVAVEEEITSVKHEIMEDETPGARCLKMEEDMDYNDHDSDDELEDELTSDLDSDEDYGTLYNCGICKATNMALQDFLSHIKLHSKAEKRLAFAKAVNSKIVKEEAAKSAAASFGFRVQKSLESSVTLYQCIVCGQGNLLLKNVQEHSLIHPQNIESNFCNICQRQFPNQKTLNLHFDVHLENNDLICQYCNKGFQLIDDLEAHEDQHYLAEYTCVDCREGFRSKEQVLTHLRKSHSNDTTCLICNVKFKSDQVINKHFMSHAIVRAVKRLIPGFTCDLCGKKYDSKVSLQRHKLFLHNKRIPFICEHCGFCAYHENPLREHIEKEHIEKEDRCVCFKCGSATNGKSNADIKAVEGISMLKNICKFCGKQFKLRDNLKKHFMSHGKVRNTNSFPKTEHLQQDSKRESPLACSQCNEIFTAEDLCITHSLYHIDSVLCDLCGKPFKSEIALNRHLNEVHINKCHKRDKGNCIFPFKCKHCSLSFKLEFELEEHCETHEDIRYQCHFCFKEFTADSDLQDHLNCHDEEVNENE